jgi:hypothetical protein
MIDWFFIDQRPAAMISCTFITIFMECKHIISEQIKEMPI